MLYNSILYISAQTVAQYGMVRYGVANCVRPNAVVWEDLFSMDGVLRFGSHQEALWFVRQKAQHRKTLW